MSLLVETEVQELLKAQSYFGMDVGLKDFAILSEGDHL
ncbi:Transposase, IS605 OrfB [Bacillus thuringiensis IBL 200]|nr:Transposase, IS605 OrfB [Bacillus thuringiensis IBL 200]